MQYFLSTFLLLFLQRNFCSRQVWLLSFFCSYWSIHIFPQTTNYHDIFSGIAIYVEQIFIIFFVSFGIKFYYSLCCFFWLVSPFEVVKMLVENVVYGYKGWKKFLVTSLIKKKKHNCTNYDIHFDVVFNTPWVIGL